MVEYVRVESRANCLMALKRSGGACVSLAKVSLGAGGEMTKDEWKTLESKCIPYLGKGDLAKYKEMCEKQKKTSGLIGDPNASCMLSCYAIKDLKEKGKEPTSVYTDYKFATEIEGTTTTKVGNFMFVFDVAEEFGAHSTETETRSDIQESLILGWILYSEVKEIWVIERHGSIWKWRKIEDNKREEWIKKQRQDAGVRANDSTNVGLRSNLQQVK